MAPRREPLTKFAGGGGGDWAEAGGGDGGVAAAEEEEEEEKTEAEVASVAASAVKFAVALARVLAQLRGCGGRDSPFAVGDKARLPSPGSAPCGRPGPLATASGPQAAAHRSTPRRGPEAGARGLCSRVQRQRG